MKSYSVRAEPARARADVEGMRPLKKEGCWIRSAHKGTVAAGYGDQPTPKSWWVRYRPTELVGLG